jgi:hypothetical protein
MRREAQGIPDTPRCLQHGRLTAHHSRRFICMGPRFASMRLKLRMASAGSRQGSLVTPGGAPMQPECARRRTRARRRRTPLHQSASPVDAPR